MKKTPNIKLTPVERRNDDKPFIKLERDLCKLEYPDGTEKEMVIDSVVRYRPDAVTIIPYCINKDGSFSVWLRSAIRPAAAKRKHKEPQFENDGNLWELPAGIIDEGETPQEAAKRECMEEVGFNSPLDNFHQIGKILSMPSLLAEILYFYAVLVDNTNQQEPTLDGSPLEYGGELTCVNLKELKQLISESKLLDMKTNLGIRMLIDELA